MSANGDAQFVARIEAAHPEQDRDRRLQQQQVGQRHDGVRLAQQLQRQADGAQPLGPVHHQ